MIMVANKKVEKMEALEMTCTEGIIHQIDADVLGGIENDYNYGRTQTVSTWT